MFAQITKGLSESIDKALAKHAPQNLGQNLSHQNITKPAQNLARQANLTPQTQARQALTRFGNELAQNPQTKPTQAVFDFDFIARDKTPELPKQTAQISPSYAQADTGGGLFDLPSQAKQKDELLQNLQHTPAQSHTTQAQNLAPHTPQSQSLQARYDTLYDFASKMSEHKEGLSHEAKSLYDSFAKSLKSLSPESLSAKELNATDRHLSEYLVRTELAQVSNAKDIVLPYFSAKYQAKNEAELAQTFGNEKLAQMRQALQESKNTNPLAEFGTNYAEFYQDGKGAIAKLIAEANAAKEAGQDFSGQVAGAFYRDDLGEITLTWGKSYKGENGEWRGFGLAHILDKHKKEFKDIARELGEVVENGVLVKESNDKIILKSSRHTIILGKKENDKFVVTGYRQDNAKKLETTQTGGAGSFADETHPRNSLSSNQQGIIPKTSNKNQIDFSARIKRVELYDIRLVDKLSSTFNLDFWFNLPDKVKNKLFYAFLKPDTRLKNKGEFRIEDNLIYINKKSSPEQISTAINAFLNNDENLIYKKDAIIFNATKKKYENFNDKQIDDLLKFHAQSHAFTKDKNGVPKEFYHGGGQNIEIFNNDSSGYGFFFSTIKDEAKGYAHDKGGGFYKVFLKIKKPFEMEKIAINSFDEYKSVLQNIGLKDIKEADYNEFLICKRFFNEIKEKALENGLKVSEINTNYGTFINKAGKTFNVGLDYDKTYPAISNLFKNIKKPADYDCYSFNGFARNELDLALLTSSENVGEYNFSKTLKDLLQKQGYDGIIFNDFQVSVFESNQIKSVKNTGSWIDSKGNISSTKPKDENAKHIYFNENTPNIYHSSSTAGGGVLGGSIAGVERDEEGNIIGFSPEKFALGFASGAAGAKALSKIANTKAVQNLANTITQNRANQNLTNSKIAQNLANSKTLQMLAKKARTNPRAKAVLDKVKSKNDIIASQKQKPQGQKQMAEKQVKSNFEVTKELEKQYRNAIVTPKQEVVKGLDLKGRVVGDFVKLAQKHPEYFAHPQEAQKLCQEVLKNAEIGINATDRRFKLIIAKVKNGKRDYGSVAIRVQNINGEHRIRSVLFMDSEQIRVKIAKAKELGEPILQF